MTGRRAHTATGTGPPRCPSPFPGGIADDRPLLLAALFVLAPLARAEDKKDAPPKGTVTGKVTLDGKPLPTGVIRLATPDGKAGVSAKIKDGKYEIAAPVGEMKVLLSVPTVIGKKKVYDPPGTPDVEITRELLPPKYNVNTLLKLVVKAGKQAADFDLKSK